MERRIAADGRPLGPGGYVGQLRNRYKKLYEEQMQLATALRRAAEARSDAHDKMQRAQHAQDTFDETEYATSQEAHRAFAHAIDMEYEALEEYNASTLRLERLWRQLYDHRELLPGVMDKVLGNMQ